MAFYDNEDFSPEALLSSGEKLGQGSDFSLVREEQAAKPLISNAFDAEQAATRVNKGAAFRKSSTKATVDEEGRVTITGSGSILGNKEARDDPFGLYAAMDKASVATDPESLLTATQSVASGYAAYEASKVREALIAAETKMKIPELEARLQQEIAADVADPYYKEYGSQDSDATKQVRAQLSQARAESRILANQLITTDPALARLKTDVDFFTKKKANQALTMMNREEAATQRALLKEDQRQLADIQRGEMLTEHEKNIANKLYPETNLGMSKGDTFNFLKNQSTKNPELTELLNTRRPEDILPLVVKNNLHAEDFLIKDSAEKIAGTDNTLSPEYRAAEMSVSSDLREFKRLAANPEEAIKTQFSAAQGDAMRAKIQEYNKTLMGMTPKEQESYSKQAGMKAAAEAMQVKKVAEFYSPAKWNTSEIATLAANPLTQAVMDRAAQKKGGKMDAVMIPDVIAEIDLLPAQDKMIAFKQVLDSAKREAERRNKGAFGLNTDALTIEQQFKGMLLKTMTNRITREERENTVMSPFFGDSGIGTAMNFGSR